MTFRIASYILKNYTYFLPLYVNFIYFIQVLNCAVAKAVYHNIITTLPDPEVYVQLYQVAGKFTFAHKLRDEIFRQVWYSPPNPQ